ncbi:MAG: MaoC family dehydratase [Gammaproteobacteria bacterium]|nr:MaoC family dehydratase [Gammaproteobacteria bacterium]
MAKIVKIADLPDMVGTDLEPSDWLEISQERVNEFASATNDQQFIHVDPERAARTPFGGPIAHGYLTLSLISYFRERCGIEPEGTVMAINYGSDKVRYLAPVRVGKRIRSRSKILEVTERKPKEWLIKTNVTIEIEDEETPALVAEILGLYLVN